MRNYLLDTCICVFLFRGMYNLWERLDTIGKDRCYISEVTVAELKYGIANGDGNPARAMRLESFLADVNIVPFSESIDLYATEKARLRREGTPVDDFDLLIGCAAVSEDMILVTDNIKHFKNIGGIEIENWVVR